MKSGIATRSAALFLFAAAWLSAQTPGLQFDAASVRARQPGSTAAMGFRGGPGTNDPGRWSCGGCQLAALLNSAYGVAFNRLVGSDWMRTETYDIAAKIPEGTSKEKFAVMLQNLLIDRFHLAAHHESKEEPVYDLVIAKSGLKLRDAAPANPADKPYRAGAVDAEGFPDLPAGRPFTATRSAAGRDRLAMRMRPIADLALMLEGIAGRPVVDKTGLRGTYDLKLEYSRALPADAAAQDSDVPIIFDVVEKQLGLKLESARGMVDRFVVDHVDKTPVEN